MFFIAARRRGHGIAVVQLQPDRAQRGEQVVQVGGDRRLVEGGAERGEPVGIARGAGTGRAVGPVAVGARFDITADRSRSRDTRRGRAGPWALQAGRIRLLRIFDIIRVRPTIEEDSPSHAAR